MYVFLDPEAFFVTGCYQIFISVIRILENGYGIFPRPSGFIPSKMNRENRRNLRKKGKDRSRASWKNFV
jgi:hypothetical protein